MMIDPEAYHKHFGRNGKSERQLKPHYRHCISPVDISVASDNARSILLLPAYVEGYHLESKKWSSVLLTTLRLVQWNHGVFDSLVLPSGIKETLTKDVQSYVDWRRRYNKNRNGEPEDIGGMDMIVGKHKGLIYHFHGQYFRSNPLVTS